MDEEKKDVEKEVKEVAEEVTKEADRPEINYQAELARKNAEIARLRAEREAQSAQPKRDPADITTWTDAELKMLRNSNDASVAHYKEQADEILLERKVRAIQNREQENRRREEVKSELEAKYPDASDPSSEFSRNMEKVMRDYDLHKSPAGRLAAAKIVEAMGKTSKVKEELKESDRVARVKANMVDGDRPKPTDVPKDLETKRTDLANKLISGKENAQVDALSEILKDRGMTQDKFFGKK